MKISKIRKTYFVLSGIVLIVIAFFIYMWFDTQRLAKALSPDSGTANKTDMATNETKPTNVKSDQADPLKSDNPEVAKSKPEENKNKTKETPKEDNKTVENPKTVRTDDWMFEKGEDIEPKKTNVNKSGATSE